MATTTSSGPLCVDLNADVGESYGHWSLGDDEALLPHVTSANVACGFHAGDPLTLRRTCEAAARHGVAIGAQVGYRDLAGFGRRFIDVEPEELRADVLYQLGALSAFALVAGTAISYVKPHGALYNTAVHHEEQAAAVVLAVAEFDPELTVLGLPGSALLAHAEAAGLNAVREAFADRGYTPDGTLVPRREPGALVTDPDVVAARAVRMVLAGEVETIDGSVSAMHPASICVHGDTPGAVAVAAAVRKALAGAGIEVASFAPAPAR